LLPVASLEFVHVMLRTDQKALLLSLESLFACGDSEMQTLIGPKMTKQPF